MPRTRSGKFYSTIVDVASRPKTATSSHVPYTREEILSLGLTSPAIKVYAGLTPAMYAMSQAKCRISLDRARYYKIVLDILDAHGSFALGHVSDKKDTLFQWTLGCFVTETYSKSFKTLVKLIHTIIHHMDTPKEISTPNYNNVTPLFCFWAIYMANVLKDAKNKSKKRCLDGIIIHLLNKCRVKGWSHKDINLQVYWHRKFSVPKMIHITDLTSPEINKYLIKTFL